MKARQIIGESRVQMLNSEAILRGKYVLYWMQASQRVSLNHALEYSILRANELEIPILVCFGLMDDYPEANARHYAFMLEGLRDAERDLRARKIKFILKRGNPAIVALPFAKQAALVVCDRGYTRHQKSWREDVARNAKCSVVQIESDVIVPVEVASDHQEFAARTIRPKIHRALKRFLKPLAPVLAKRSSLDMKLRGDKISLDKLKLDNSVAPSSFFRGGYYEARKRLDRFVASRLDRYAEDRNEPALDATSTLSPYLHFGQISPIEIALRCKNEKFLEELIVRRELDVNFVHYCADYDRYDSLPNWAKRTLKQHARDRRSVTYTLGQLERALTHDSYWNAAQSEMLLTGYMHNYMRMYWGKKIIEWTKNPKRAYETALHLNNKYFLDGRDPASFANVGWLFGLHDRPWGPARKIFGTVRYMNDAGLRRKFDMDSYVKKIARLT